MRKSLMQGLNERDMQAVVNTLNLNDFYYSTLFPLQFTPTLTWKTLAGDKGVPVAADVIAYDSSAPIKTREVVKRLTGDIPKIDIKRVLGETKINEYNQLLSYANTDQGRLALVKFIYDDVDFCFRGVNARLEWLAIRALSTGKITLSKDNNHGIITETAVDFQVPTTNKKGVAVVWSGANADTAKPITNIRAVVKLARKAGKKLGFVIMNQTTFEVLAACKETIDFAASWVQQATGLTRLPSLEAVNTALKSESLPMIKIVESYISIEAPDGTRTVVEPWEEGCVTFVSELAIGTTWHGPQAAESTDSPAIKTKRGHILIQKWGENEPVQEVTKGSANAFPSLNDPDAIWMLDTLHANWSH